MFLLFDIGGTKTRIAYSADGEAFSPPHIIDTPQFPDEGVEEIIRTGKELAGANAVKKAVGGVRGYLNADKTKLERDEVLTEWRHYPLGQKLEEVFACPVVLENDAALAGLGEAVYGAGKEYDIVAYLTISTGVGGARIDNKEIDHNASGFEPGKQIIDPDGTLCPECHGNTLEDYISGRAVEEREGKKPYEILDKGYWNRIAHFTAYGLHNLILGWSPHVVVLGGSMTKEIGIAISDVERHLIEIGGNLPAVPAIKKAHLGDIGGLYGALALARIHS